MTPGPAVLFPRLCVPVRAFAVEATRVPLSTDHAPRPFSKPSVKPSQLGGGGSSGTEGGIASRLASSLPASGSTVAEVEVVSSETTRYPFDWGVVFFRKTGY